MNERYVSSYWVRGISFRNLPEVSIKFGDEVIHTPEPDNEYDANAIKLTVGDTHIGYMPKELCIPYKESNMSIAGYVCEIKLQDALIVGLNIVVSGENYLPKQKKVQQ